MVRNQHLSEANELANDFQKLFDQHEKVEVDEATKKKLDIIEQIKVADDADTVNKLLQELLEKMQNEQHPEAKAE
ncbi:hypothetical protein JNUCC42_00155 [Brevibacterium sp. JNUCC-42]|nr:hypothetical protein JNUCC42_00155 [Brevibacterium sp. JNUCC-42]